MDADDATENERTAAEADAETKTLWTGFRPAVHLCCDYVYDWKNGGRSRCNGYCASSPLWAVFNLYEKDLHLWLIPVDEQRKV